jgi:hypothetical protein
MIGIEQHGSEGNKECQRRRRACLRRLGCAFVAVGGFPNKEGGNLWRPVVDAKAKSSY